MRHLTPLPSISALQTDPSRVAVLRPMSVQKMRCFESDTSMPSGRFWLTTTGANFCVARFKHKILPFDCTCVRSRELLPKPTSNIQISFAVDCGYAGVVLALGGFARGGYMPPLSLLLPKRPWLMYTFLKNGEDKPNWYGCQRKACQPLIRILLFLIRFYIFCLGSRIVNFYNIPWPWFKLYKHVPFFV